MSYSYHIDASRYPATAGLLSQARINPPRQVHSPGLRLTAVTGRAMRVASHAMEMGDQATACLMAEAFSRLALFPSDPSDPTANRKDRMVLTNFALALTDCAYPRLGPGVGVSAEAKDDVAEDLPDPKELADISEALAAFDALLLTSEEGVH